MSKIVIACGGTGGHLAPGIAVAEVLQAQGHDCRLLISQKQVDSALIA
ncbi:MAG: glycosyltransferase, partial [Opitutales bacterium]|nr:glycosyltransferase [Opitutales bacterium]